LDLSENKPLFNDLVTMVQNDAALIDTYKHFDTEIPIDVMVQVIHDVFTANDDKMEIKLVQDICGIKLSNFFLSINAMASLTTDERSKIVQFLKSLNEDHKDRFLTVQDYVGTNSEFLRMLAKDNATELIEIWYDVFVICFDEHLATIPSENIIRLRNLEIPIDILKVFTKEERLNIIFTIKSFTEIQSHNFKKLIELVDDPEIYYKSLAKDNEMKEKFIVSLNEKLP